MNIQTNMHQFYRNLTVTNDKNPYEKALSAFRSWNISNSTALLKTLNLWGWGMW